MASSFFSNSDLISGLIGGLLGVLGGSHGFYFAWRAAKSQRQVLFLGVAWMPLAVFNVVVERSAEFGLLAITASLVYTAVLLGFGLVGGVIAFRNLWREAGSRKAKRPLIGWSLGLLLFVGVHCFIQFFVENKEARMTDLNVYAILLTGLALHYHRRTRCFTAPAG